jgi:hypothetical protein
MSTEDLSPKTTVQRHVVDVAGAGVAEGGGADGFGTVGWAAMRVMKKKRFRTG